MHMCNLPHEVLPHEVFNYILELKEQILLHEHKIKYSKVINQLTHPCYICGSIYKISNCISCNGMCCYVCIDLTDTRECSLCLITNQFFVDL